MSTEYERGYADAVIEALGMPYQHPGGGHVCMYVELDGTTAGACHLPGQHGGRLPDRRTAADLPCVSAWGVRWDGSLLPVPEVGTALVGYIGQLDGDEPVPFVSVEGPRPVRPRSRRVGVARRIPDVRAVPRRVA
jgi:hypothetical protein